MKYRLSFLLGVAFLATSGFAQNSFDQGGGLPGYSSEPQNLPAAPQTGWQPQGFQPQSGTNEHDIPQNDQTDHLDRLMQMERQDFGVPPTDQLHNGPMHGMTPASIPGGQVITTKGLVALVQGQQAPYLLFHVLDWPEALPGAIPAVGAAMPGSFNDQNQQAFGQYLQQITQGNTQIPLVFYCASLECWMSYNASLRAIKLGYQNVLWYRGGLDAWKRAGFQTVQLGGPQQPQQQPPQQQPRQQQPWQQAPQQGQQSWQPQNWQ